MDLQELESRILQNTETWISKNKLFLKVGSQKQRFLDTVRNLIDNGNLDSRNVGNTQEVIRNLSNADDITWNSVFDYLKGQMELAVKSLQDHKRSHYFQVDRREKVRVKEAGKGLTDSNLETYVEKSIRVAPEIKTSMMVFCWNVDTLMQHIIKLEYAKVFSLAPLNKLQTRQKRLNALLKKSVDSVNACFKNDKDRIEFRNLIQSIDRTWNIHV